MANVPNMTVDEMKAKAAALQAEFASIEAELQLKMSRGAAAAQTARLVAFALFKQASSMFENVQGTLAFMSRAEASGAEGGVMVRLADALVEMMTDQFGVEEAAITPFVYETNCICVPVIEDLLAKAKAKLAEADAIEGAIDSSCVEVKE